MVKLLRLIGCFVYSTIVSALFAWVAIYALVETIYIESVWWSICACFLTILTLSWITEDVFALLSIPYNYLWDLSAISRWMSAVPPVLAWLWMIWAPWRLVKSFTVGDWVISAIWMFLVTVGYLSVQHYSNARNFMYCEDKIADLLSAPLERLEIKNIEKERLMFLTAGISNKEKITNYKLLLSWVLSLPVTD